MAVDRTRLLVPSLVRQNLDAFVSGLGDLFGPRLRTVRLFGSNARGTAHEDSDVDCLVQLDRVTPGDDRVVTDLAGESHLADRRRRDFTGELATVASAMRMSRSRPEASLCPGLAVPNGSVGLFPVCGEVWLNVSRLCTTLPAAISFCE